jgi:hypothetical protein
VRWSICIQKWRRSISHFPTTPHHTAALHVGCVRACVGACVPEEREGVGHDGVADLLQLFGREEGRLAVLQHVGQLGAVHLMMVWLVGGSVGWLVDWKGRKERECGREQQQRERERGAARASIDCSVVDTKDERRLEGGDGGIQNPPTLFPYMYIYIHTRARTNHTHTSRQ